MKSDIHPDYVETQVTCTCGNTFTTRSTITSGTTKSDVCSNCHPFYTGKQKILDTGGRVARFEARYAKKAADARRPPTSRRVAAFPSADPRTAGVGALHLSALLAREATMFDAVDGLEAEHAELESRLGDPEVHADARLAKQLNQRYAELSRILGAKSEYDALVEDIEAARELAAEDPSFAAEAEALADRLQGDRGAAAPAARPARPHRRQGRDPRGEVG